MSRNATQNASVGGWTELRLAASLAERSKRVILFDNMVIVESGRIFAALGGCRTPNDLTEAYSLSLTLP